MSTTTKKYIFESTYRILESVFFLIFDIQRMNHTLLHDCVEAHVEIVHARKLCYAYHLNCRTLSFYQVKLEDYLPLRCGSRRVFKTQCYEIAIFGLLKNPSVRLGTLNHCLAKHTCFVENENTPADVFMTTHAVRVYSS